MGECAETFVVDVAPQTLFESLVIFDVLHRKVFKASVLTNIQLDNCVCVLLGVHLDIAEVSHPCVCLTFFGNDRINSVDEKCDAPHNDYMDKFGSEMRASR